MGADWVGINRLNEFWRAGARVVGREAAKFRDLGDFLLGFDVGGVQVGGWLVEDKALASVVHNALARGKNTDGFAAGLVEEGSENGLDDELRAGEIRDLGTTDG